MIKENYIDIDNNKIFYIENKSEGKPILFLHGNSLSSEVFINQLQEPSLNEYRLIALDWLGHGKSSKASEPKKNYTLPYFINILDKFIKQLNLKDITIVANSLGGHVAIEASEQIKEISAYFITGMAPISSLDDIGSAFLPNEVNSIIYKDNISDDEINKMINAYVNNKENNYQELKNIIQKSDPHFRSFFGLSVGEGLIKNEIELLNKINKPIEFIYGENEELINFNYVEKNLSKYKVTKIKATKHILSLENSKYFNELLRDFLYRV